MCQTVRLRCGVRQVRHDCPPEALLAVLSNAVRQDTFAAAHPHAQAQSAVRP